MVKRLMLAVVGAGIGALSGLLAAAMGMGTPALWIGAAVGAIVPQFVIGPPGH
jgi:hypothetical protein